MSQKGAGEGECIAFRWPFDLCRVSKTREGKNSGISWRHGSGEERDMKKHFQVDWVCTGRATLLSSTIDEYGRSRSFDLASFSSDRKEWWWTSSVGFTWPDSHTRSGWRCGVHDLRRRNPAILCWKIQSGASVQINSTSSKINVYSSTIFMLEQNVFLCQQDSIWRISFFLKDTSLL